MILEWLAWSAATLLGLGLMGVVLWNIAYGLTPENDLTLVEGEPSDVDLSERQVRFTVAGHRIEYSRDGRPPVAVVGAALSGRPVRAWVSTRRENLLRRDGPLPLYKLSVGDRAVLSYAEAAEAKSRVPPALPICSGLALLFGVGGLVQCFRDRRRSADVEAMSARVALPNDEAPAPAVESIQLPTSGGRCDPSEEVDLRNLPGPEHPLRQLESAGRATRRRGALWFLGSLLGTVLSYATVEPWGGLAVAGAVAALYGVVKYLDGRTTEREAKRLLSGGRWLEYRRRWRG
jgi:hypothetical protein